MPEYHRVYVQGATYFFTVVTYLRRPIFDRESSTELLYECLNAVGATTPFQTLALVILPDHLHTIWTLPENDTDFPTRWKRIKGLFTRQYHEKDLYPISISRISKGEKDIWQRRYWEHLIRDDEDLERHYDYIHYNPVKHGYVDHPSKWKFGTYSSFIQRGIYQPDWGTLPPLSISNMECE